MENSKKGKVIQMLSPENYIRQKARNLPIYECLVNANWEESQIANLVIARQHPNGNITAGLFLVDLACLGVKDSTWFFNISIAEYRENLEEYMKIEEGIDKIDYVLAHNIVHAGLEFADNYEFKPHKDFTSVTQFILDEDTDNIPIIEIECGIDGLPAFIQGPLDSDPKAKQIIAHLERVAGNGNYYLIDEDGMVLNDKDFDPDEEDDQFADMSPEEKRNEFVGYFKKINQLSKDEAAQLFILTQSIVDDLIDFDKYDEYLEVFDQELSEIEVNDEVIPDEMLGVEPGGVSLPSEVKKQFLEILDISSDLKKLKKQLATFRKNPGVEAASAYLDLIVAEMEESKSFDDLLKTAAEKYPRYGLVQMRWAETKIDAIISGAEENSSYQYNYFFTGRDFIHSGEYYNYLHLRSLVIAHEGNLEKLEAWKEVLFDYQTDEIDLTMLNGFIVMFQIGLVADRLKIK
jgi:hypothetical protein